MVEHLLLILALCLCDSKCPYLVVVVVYLLSHVWPFATPWTVACQAPLSWDFPGKNTGVGCHFLFQRIFWTLGLNLHCLHWQAGSLPSEPPEKPCPSLRVGSNLKFVAFQEYEPTGPAFMIGSELGLVEMLQIMESDVVRPACWKTKNTGCKLS